MLTISQLASYAGVTVRAVRHYHARDLLTEPPRDHSGYRRYGAQHVIELIRIRTLASAGVPLGNIRALLDGTPPEYAAALAGVDDDLRRRIAELESHRRDLAKLGQPERLCLPADCVEIQERLRAAGLSERTLAHFRDGWILLAAIAPAERAQAMASVNRQLDDPDYCDLLQRADAAADWAVDDPRLQTLAESAVALEKRKQAEEADAGAGDENDVPHQLLNRFQADASPAWERLNELIDEILAGQVTGLTDPAEARLRRTDR